MRAATRVIAALLALIAAPALTQTPPDGTPTRIRGTVERLDGHTLLVKSRDGRPGDASLLKPGAAVFTAPCARPVAA